MPQYGALAKEKNITMNIRKNAELSIESNSYYIDRIFDNIISNAIFYNDGNGEIIITIDHKSVSIQDQGI